MDKHLPKIQIFDPARMKKLASEHLSKWVIRFSDKGQDYRGQQFPEYSESYIDFLTDYGQKKHKRSRYKQVPLTVGTPFKKKPKIPPFKLARRQFLLTGGTAKRMKYISSDNKSYTLGWNNPREASIVEDNAGRRKKRDIISDIPEREWKYIENFLGVSIDQEFRKIKDVTIRVKS